MLFFRSLLFLCLACLLASLILLFLGSVSVKEGYSGGYAVLSADDSYNDRETSALLNEDKNNFAGSVVSESSQWVIIDDFGSLETVPLDKFSSRLASFDPRNDGYAEKLISIFVRDGKRYFYIPLKSDNSVPSNLNRQFKDLLGDIPFSVDYFGIDKPYMLFFVSYAAACAALLLVCYVKKVPRAAFVSTIALLPLLSCLAFFGSAGIAAAALFFGIFFMLREPLNELASLLFSKEKKKLILKNLIEPYRIYWLFLPVFAAAVGIIAVFSQLNVLFLLAVFIISCAIFIFSPRTLSFSGTKHTRFIPVQIIRRRFVDFSFSAYMLPFIASSFLVLFLTPFTSGALAGSGDFSAPIIEEKDYYAHLAFQSSFSMRKLGESGDTYPAFVLDKDGLPSVDKKPAVLSHFNPDQFPPFPLKHLMAFFSGVSKGEKIKKAGSGGLKENLSLLVLLVFILPEIFLKNRIIFPQRGQLSGFKGLTRKIFSQMPRRTDKTRKNVLLYNAGNTLHLRKDA